MAPTLEAVLAHYHAHSHLRQRGKKLVGTCPIHRGSNPRQFVVNLPRQSWFCFGDCHRGGGPLHFLAAMEGVSLRDAARLAHALFPQPQWRPIMKKHPTHSLWIVEDKQGDEQKPIWHRIASGWTQRDGRGLTFQLPPGVSVSGRLIVRENDQAERDRSSSGA